MPSVADLRVKLFADGADLEVMARDSKLMRGNRPFVFTNLKSRAGLEDVVAWIRRELLYENA